MASEHEALREGLARAIWSEDEDEHDTCNRGKPDFTWDDWPEHGGPDASFACVRSKDGYRALADAALRFIAERTKEATPEMIEVGRKAFQRPGYGPRVAQEFTAMHAASALWPPRDSTKDVEGERG